MEWHFALPPNAPSATAATYLCHILGHQAEFQNFKLSLCLPIILVENVYRFEKYRRLPKPLMAKYARSIKHVSNSLFEGDELTTPCIRRPDWAIAPDCRLARAPSKKIRTTVRLRLRAVRTS
jgi:hypothetical protein